MPRWSIEVEPPRPFPALCRSVTERVRLASGTCAVLALAVARIAPAVAQAASPAFDIDVPITGFVERLVVGYGDKSLAPGGEAELNLTFDAGAAGLVLGLYACSPSAPMEQIGVIS